MHTNCQAGSCNAWPSRGRSFPTLRCSLPTSRCRWSTHRCACRSSICCSDLRDEFGVSVIYITHDLATAYYISDRLVIMQKGFVVEMGPARPILDAPEHPYSRLLKESVLSITDAGTDALVPADRAEATAALERAAEGTLQEREDGRFVRL